MFAINQKVVCVDANDNKYVKVGTIYTVRDIRDESDRRGGGLALHEAWQILDASFYARRFRPVVERKTDISIFTAMLKPSDVTVDALKLSDVAREIIE